MGFLKKKKFSTIIRGCFKSINSFNYLHVSITNESRLRSRVNKRLTRVAFYSEIGTHLLILCFFLYQTVLKKHTKIKKRRLLLVRRYLGFTFFFVLYRLPFLLCFVKLSFSACAGRRLSTENSCAYCYSVCVLDEVLKP